MVKHRSGTRWLDDREVECHCVWSAPCTRRRGVQISWFCLKTMVDGLFRFSLKIGGFGFYSLCLKTGSYGLVIWTSKSPRQFLGLCLKTKRAIVSQLRHKIDGRIKTSWDTRWDLAAYFVWKQDGLEFSSLASRLSEAWRGWCMWHYRGGCVKLKLKIDGSMWHAVSDPSITSLLFSMY
jgi:hypothetical protein